MKKTIRQEIIKIVNDAQIKFPPSRPMGNMLECIFIDKLQELFETTSMRYESSTRPARDQYECSKCAEHKIDRTMIDEDI